MSRPVINAVSKSLDKLNNDEAMIVGNYAVDRIAHR